MRKLPILALAAALALAASGADPYAGYIYPAGIQAGTTNRILIGGQNLNRARVQFRLCESIEARERSIRGVLKKL